MKKQLFIICILFFISKVYSLDVILNDMSKIINTRTDGKSDIYVFFLDNHPLVVNSQRSEIFINNNWRLLLDITEDREIIDTYAKYGVIIQNYIDTDDKHLYMEISSYIDNSLYYCFDFYINEEQLIKKRLNHHDLELKKDSLISLWQDFPITLLDGSELQFYSKFIKFGEYKKFFQITNIKQNVDIFNFLQDYKMLGRPCINMKKNKIICYACSKKNNENKLFEDCNIFLFSIVYDASINCDDVIVYTNPNCCSDVTAVLNKDFAKVKVLDQSNNSEIINGEEWYWYKIELTDGKTGWVYGKYLNIEQ